MRDLLKPIAVILLVVILLWSCTGGPLKEVRQSAFDQAGQAISGVRGEPKPTTVVMLPSPTIVTLGTPTGATPLPPTVALPATPTPVGPTPTPGPGLLERADKTVETAKPYWERVYPFLKSTGDDIAFVSGTLKNLAFGPKRGDALQKAADDMPSTIWGSLGLAIIFVFLMFLSTRIILRLIGAGAKEAKQVVPSGVRKRVKVQMPENLFDPDIILILFLGAVLIIWVLIQIAVIAEGGTIHKAAQVLTLISGIAGLVVTSTKLLPAFWALIGKVWEWGQKPIEGEYNIKFPLIGRLISAALNLLAGIFSLVKFIVGAIGTLAYGFVLAGALAEVYTIFLQAGLSIFDVKLATVILTRLTSLAEATPEAVATEVPKQVGLLERILSFIESSLAQYFGLLSDLNAPVMDKPVLVSILALTLLAALIYLYRPIAGRRVRQVYHPSYTGTGTVSPQSVVRPGSPPGEETSQ